VINVNTRFAFAKVTEFDPKEVEISINSRKKWDARTKAQREVISGTIKTAQKTADAFEEILQEMKELKGRHLKELSGFKGTVDQLKGYKFRVKTLYTDDGSEFKGEFTELCDRLDIHHVQFTPSTGTKRRLGIVERFNRTLKRLIRKERERQKQRGNKVPSVKELLPIVLKDYNFKNPHTGLVQTIREAKGMRKHEREDPEKKISTTTPYLAMRPGIERGFIEQKKRKREEVEDFYKDEITKMKRRPKVRFFKTLNTSHFKRFSDRFQHQGSGTLTDRAYRLAGRHVYGADQKTGDSFEMEGLPGFRVLPYDVVYPSKAFLKRMQKTKGKERFLWK
jgi:hypothetical protein